MAHKFRIGDTVEVVPGAWNCDTFKIGHRGKVTKFLLNHPYPYEVRRKNGEEYIFSAKELKLIKRKGE